MEDPIADPWLCLKPLHILMLTAKDQNRPLNRDEIQLINRMFGTLSKLASGDGYLLEKLVRDRKRIITHHKKALEFLAGEHAAKSHLQNKGC